MAFDTITINMSAASVPAGGSLFSSAHFFSGGVTPIAVDSAQYRIDCLNPFRMVRDWTPAVPGTSSSVNIDATDNTVQTPVPFGGIETFQITWRANVGAVQVSAGATWTVVPYRVQAMAPGFDQGVFREVGDIWDTSQVSDYTVSIVPPGNPDYPLYGWMKLVPSNTPLFSQALGDGTGRSAEVVATSGVNAAGHFVYGNRRRYVA